MNMDALVNVACALTHEESAALGETGFREAKKRVSEIVNHLWFLSEITGNQDCELLYGALHETLIQADTAGL